LQAICQQIACGPQIRGCGKHIGQNLHIRAQKFGLLGQKRFPERVGEQNADNQHHQGHKIEQRHFARQWRAGNTEKPPPRARGAHLGFNRIPRPNPIIPKDNIRPRRTPLDLHLLPLMCIVPLSPNLLSGFVIFISNAV
jgi:hypothetical protein